MTIVDPRTWLEILPAKACWELLRTTPVGRLGFNGPDGPEILPVNFVLDGESVVFRTERGTKLEALIKHGSVCFEADGIDASNATGWSVLLKGRAHHLGDAKAIARLEQLDLRYWSVGDKPNWVRVAPAEVTGRRIHRPGAQ